MAGAARKAFDLMRLLRRSSAPLGVTDVARELGIAPSTAHGLLAELTFQGAVEADETRRYRLGPAMHYLGAAYVRNLPLYRAAWSGLVALSRESALTGVIGAPWRDHHIVLQVHSSGSATLEVLFGGLVPIDAAAWGKAYYAWSGEAIPQAVRSYNPADGSVAVNFVQQVAEARARGYAVDREEFVPGSGAVASAVTSQRGFEGIVALHGTLDELEHAGVDAMGRRLAALAVRASDLLGDHARLLVVGAA